MHKYLLSVILGLAMVVSGPVLATSEKVGVVDYQKLMQEIPFSAIMQNKLKASMEETRSTFKGLNDEIKAKQAELDKNKDSWNEERTNNAKAEMADLRKELSKKQMEVRKQAMDRQKGMQQEIQDEIHTVAKKVAKEKGLSRVFRSDSLIYDDNKIDITSEVTAHLTKVYNVTPEMKQMQQQRMMPPRHGGRMGH